MAERIYMVEGRNLVAMEASSYESEDLLQELLANHPNLLAGSDDSGEASRWLLIRREMAVPDAEEAGRRWSLDHLFVDLDGIPTLVEVKRSSDTRIRREVVGQLLDYAANAVVYWPIEKVRTSFEATCNGDADEVLADFLQDEHEPEAFWQLVKTNLQAGRIRLVFVADVIPPELRRVIEFLNGQMDPAEVVGIEVRQFLGQGLRTLVPRLVGRTATSEVRKGGAASLQMRITEADYRKAVEDTLSSSEARAVLRLVDWARQSKHNPSFKLGANGATCTPEVLLGGNGALHPVFIRVKRGVILKLHDLRRRPPFDTSAGRDELLRRLERIEGLELRGGIDGMPRLPFAALARGRGVEQLIETLE